MITTLRSASEIVDKAVAIKMAETFAKTFGEPYAVFHYADVNEYDVEPASPNDGMSYACVHVALPLTDGVQ